MQVILWPAVLLIIVRRLTGRAQLLPCALRSATLKAEDQHFPHVLLQHGLRQ